MWCNDVNLIENDIGEQNNRSDEVLKKGRNSQPDEWTERNLLLQEDNEKVSSKIGVPPVGGNGHYDKNYFFTPFIVLMTLSCLSAKRGIIPCGHQGRQSSQGSLVS